LGLKVQFRALRRVAARLNLSQNSRWVGKFVLCGLRAAML
jgi:hypothetical protein